MNWGDLMHERSNPGQFPIYMRSKLCNNLFGNELSRRLQGELNWFALRAMLCLWNDYSSIQNRWLVSDHNYCYTRLRSRRKDVNSNSKKLHHFNRHEFEMIQLVFRSRIFSLWLFFGIRLHPKTSDSLRLRNPDLRSVSGHEERLLNGSFIGLINANYLCD